MQVSTSAMSNEQQIREIAYSIWEQAGRPMGQADWHWEMAKQAPSPAKAAKAPVKAKAKAKVAAPAKRRAAPRIGRDDASLAMA